MSPARNVAAWRTLRCSAAPSTISAPLSPAASTTSPAATGPVRTHDPRTGAAHGSPCAAPPAATSEHATSTATIAWRSEEHTSELQSHSDLVCRLLLEKKKNEEPTGRL